MTKKASSYQDMMDDLQAIIDDLQSDDISVDLALEKYERGQQLIGELAKYLKNATNRIEQLSMDQNIGDE